MSTQNLKLVIAMARAYNALFVELGHNIASFGVTVSEFGVLEMLLHKGKQPVQRIGEKILVTSGTITSVINKLEKRGYVQRKKCEKDGRVYYVSLTASGSKFISKIFPQHEIYLDKLVADIDESSKKILTNKLMALQGLLNAKNLNNK